MRKLLTILLLSLLVFNWVGYRLLSQYLEDRSNLKLEAQLDQQQYNEEDLIEIRIPVNLPYQNDTREFERIDGEITLGDVHYKYVKRKIENGQLVLKCIPNETKMALQTARDRFFALVNDLQQKGQHKDSKAPGLSFKSLFNEYCEQQNNYSISSPAIKENIFAVKDAKEYNSATILPATPPPDHQA
jgi:hypothetical protein